VNSRSHIVYAAYALLVASVGVVRPAWCTSGEGLLQQLRKQIDVQRNILRQEDLASAGDTTKKDSLAIRNDQDIECNSTTMANYQANRDEPTAPRLDKYIYNATYTRVRLLQSQGSCTYLERPIDRPLTIGEAHDLEVAEHLEFPPYTPSAKDLQIAEDGFFTLRQKSQELRVPMSQSRLGEIESDVGHLSNCSNETLADVSRELSARIENNEIILGVNWAARARSVASPIQPARRSRSRQPRNRSPRRCCSRRPP
jgi:hypothetical protein